MSTPALAHGVAHDGTQSSWAPLRWVVIAVAACLAATGSVLLAHASDHFSEPGFHAALLNWTTLPYIAAGAIAWVLRPDSRLGPLMVAAGFVMFLSSLQWSSMSIPFTVGMVFDLLPTAIFLHVFLAFPSGRLEHGVDRTIVVLAYAAALGLQLGKMLLWNVDGQNELALTNEQGAALTVEDIELFGLSMLSLVGAAALLFRRRGLVRPLRPAVARLLDSFAIGLVGVAVLLVAGALEWPHFENLRRVTFGVVGIAPLAFLIGLLSARLSRSTLGELLVQLKDEPAPADLRDSLAVALRDPSLTLAYWLPEFHSWVDGRGRPIDLPADDSDRSTKLIGRDGAPVAALVHDPSLTHEPELLDAVSAAAAMALENERLHAELRARLDELRGSRQRVIEAGQEERQRLERDLHDGAQQRLIALSLELGRLDSRVADDPEVRGRLDQARREVAMSLEELRAVARGIHPAVVSGHGLGVALESLAARAPVPVRLDVRLDGRMPERLEVAAYYVVCESLANVSKHAQATSATVEVGREDGQLLVEVVDDGIGGADTERGTGLRGLADRVEALGGRLRVWTPRGEGTRVRAELPCA
jgi:signal transduction histidine kinase